MPTVTETVSQIATATVITGTYNETTLTVTLDGSDAVEFGSWTLGTDSELQATGANWTLTLPVANAPTVEDKYTCEATDGSGSASNPLHALSADHYNCERAGGVVWLLNAASDAIHTVIGGLSANTLVIGESTAAAPHTATSSFSLGNAGCVFSARDGSTFYLDMGGYTWTISVNTWIHKISNVINSGAASNQIEVTGGTLTALDCTSTASTGGSPSEPCFIRANVGNACIIGGTFTDVRYVYPTSTSIVKVFGSRVIATSANAINYPVAADNTADVTIVNMTVLNSSTSLAATVVLLGSSTAILNQVSAYSSAGSPVLAHVFTSTATATILDSVVEGMTLDTVASGGQLGTLHNTSRYNASASTGAAYLVDSADTSLSASNFRDPSVGDFTPINASLGGANPAVIFGATYVGSVKSESGYTDMQLAGERILEGDSVYKSNGLWYRADNTTALKAGSSGCAIAVTGADASGNRLVIQTTGDIDIGITLDVGKTYAIGPTKGSIVAICDVASGAYKTILGTAKTTSLLGMSVDATGVAVA